MPFERADAVTTVQASEAQAGSRKAALKEAVLKTEEILRTGRVSLSAAEVRREAELLACRALGLSYTEFLLRGTRLLEPEELRKIENWAVRRAAGEPVAYIFGSRGFYGCDFAVGPGVLVPRPETEMLVELALERAFLLHKNGAGTVRALDLCSGSGCVALSLKKEAPFLDVTGQELDDKAAGWFMRNLSGLGLEGQVELLRGSLFDEVQGRFDIITANPPYIGTDEDPSLCAEAAAFEPGLALFSGHDGLELIRQIAAGAQDYLAPGGMLAVEIGWKQGEAAAALFADAGLKNVSVLQDFNGLNRVVCSFSGRI